LLNCTLLRTNVAIIFSPRVDSQASSHSCVISM
jgi:hypothetical protein